MPQSSNDRLRSLLVLLATAAMIVFNGLAAAGLVNNVTPAEIADRYPTVLTPAVYAFSIWSLIYLGLTVFAVLQLLPGNLERLRHVRTLYITSCLLNIGWLYFWHYDHPDICLVIILGLALTLLILIAQMKSAQGIAPRIAKATFGIYAGWITTAVFVNLFVVFKAFGILTPATENALGVVAIMLASVIVVLVVWKLRNYLFPLAVAWGITAIAIKQSVNTPIVVASAVSVVVCLIASLSFVMSLPTVNVQTRNE